MKAKKRRRFPVFAVVMVLVCLLTLAGLFLLNRWRVELSGLGPREVTLEYGSAWEAPKVQALLKGDLILRDGRPLEVRQSGQVDLKRLGDYRLRWEAEGLMERAEAEMTVHVVDTTPPVIQLTPDTFDYLLPGTEYEEAGCSASDNVDGDLSAREEAASEGTSTRMFGRARMTAMSSSAWWEEPSKASDMPQ